MKIDFLNVNTITNLNDETIEVIWSEFVRQSKQADVCFVDNGPLLENWDVDEYTFSCNWFAEDGMSDFVVNFDNLCEVQIMGPGHWILFEQRNENSHIQHQLRTEVRFYELKPVVPISLPEGWKEYCEGDTAPEQYGLVDVLYHDGNQDNAMRPDEITWTSFSVKGWKPCDEEIEKEGLKTNGPLSWVVPFADKLIGHAPFIVYEVEAMIEGEERTEVIAVGEYDHDVWDAIKEVDENIYFWVDADDFKKMSESLKVSTWKLDGDNYIISIDESTKTVFM